VHLQRLTPQEIEWYLAKGEYRDKAGAYGIQGYAALFIDRIEGCYFNVVGFPYQLFTGFANAWTSSPLGNGDFTSIAKPISRARLCLSFQKIACHRGHFNQARDSLTRGTV